MIPMLRQQICKEQQLTNQLLMADMGLTRKLIEDESHISSTSSAGTLGWQPPEVLRGERAGVTVDVFSFGLVSYFMLSQGGHPFGNPGERVARIERFEPSFEWFDLHHYFVAKDLVISCVQQNPLLRPQFECLLIHPYFWSVDRAVAFLQETKKVFDHGPRIRSKFDELTVGLDVFPLTGWYDVPGMQEIADSAQNEFTDESKRKLSPLLKLCRNVCSHQPQNAVWNRFKTNSDAVQFFFERFPKLLIVSWLKIREVMKLLNLEPPKDLQGFYSAW